MTRAPRAARRRAGAAVLLLAAALAGCATAAAGNGLRAADERFAAGDLAGAADAYQAALAAGAPPAEQERALFRLALIHSLAGTSLHDPGRAEELLARLAAEHPVGPFGRAASQLLARERERRRLAGDLAVERARADALAARLERAESRTAEAAGETAAASQTAEARARETSELRRRAAELEAELARCREQVAKLEAELAGLKAIDLEEP